MAQLGRGYPAVPIILAAVLSAQTWGGSDATALVTATAGSFSAAGATATWSGNDATAVVIAESGAFSSGTTTWSGNGATALVTATAGSFSVSGTATWSGGNATGVVTATSGAFSRPGAGTGDVSISGRKLIKSGSPWMLKSMSSWALAQRMSDANITSYLTSVAALGFNAVAVGPCGFDYGPTTWGDRYVDYAGNQFFATVAGGNIADTAITGQLGAAWARMDWVMSESVRLGLQVVFSMYTGYNNTEGIGQALVTAGTSGAYTYGTRVGARYAAYTNIIWHYGADWEFDYGTLSSTNPSKVVDAFFHGLTDTVGTNWVFVCEPRPTQNTYDGFIAQQGIDPAGYNWAHFNVNDQYGHGGAGADEFDVSYTQAGATSYPVWRCELAYDGSNHFGNGADSAAEGQQIREEFYSTFMRGGIGANWGSEYIASFGGDTFWVTSPSYITGLARTECVRMQYANTAVDLAADATFAPSSSFVTTGTGTGGTKAAIGASDSKALAYFPNSRTIAVDTTIISGSANVRLRWFDPTAGTYTTITSGEAQQSGRSVTHPGNHADGTADWLLVVDLSQDQTWTGGTATALVTATAGAFTGSGTVAWSGGNATALVTATAGAFTGSGTATWTGADATALVTAASGSFGLGAGPQTWGGNDATALAAADPGAFTGSDTATWIGADATATVTATAGTFFGGAGYPTINGQRRITRRSDPRRRTGKADE